MGLDNFWEIPEGAEQPKFDRELNLCGGMFSANGEGSFRGKVYANLVESLTGVSLYEDLIDNKTVRVMAMKIANTSYEKALEHDSWGMFTVEEDSDLTEEDCREQWKDFQEMFLKYAEAGAELVSWY